MSDDISLPDFAPNDTPVASDEAERIRSDARRLGANDFIAFYLFGKGFNIRRLINVFKDQFCEQEWRDISGDIMGRGQLPELYACIHIAVQRFIKRRRRLEHINSLEHVEQLLRTSKKIMLISGAGISVSCGIPDFRSKDGIYARLNDYELEDPTQMFDLDYFKHKPQTFYSFANEIYPSNFKPSPSHAFVALLEEKCKLLRNYTQNIDTIEELAGIKRVIQCHGSFRNARCVTCGHTVPGKEIEAEIFAKEVPKCKACPEDSEFPVMKPDIVFFGEQLPEEFHRTIKVDVLETDCVIVIGSSLKVAPVSEILRAIPDKVPQIIINRELLPHLSHHFDVHLLGNADAITQEICRRMGWVLKHPAFNKDRTPASFIFHEPNMYVFEGGQLTCENWSGIVMEPSSSDRGGSDGDEGDDEDDDDGGERHGSQLKDLLEDIPTSEDDDDEEEKGDDEDEEDRNEGDALRPAHKLQPSGTYTTPPHDTNGDADGSDSSEDSYSDGVDVSDDELAALRADLSIAPPPPPALPADPIKRPSRIADDAEDVLSPQKKPRMD